MNNLVLIGFKGVGKTRLGKEMALHLGYNFIDTDNLIAADCHRFYREVGEKAFRLIEKGVIGSLFKFKRTVIATGGGSILDPDNILTFKKIGKVIYLYLPKNELKKRLLKQPIPSFLEGDNFEISFEKMYQERSYLYEKIADVVINLNFGFIS